MIVIPYFAMSLLAAPRYEHDHEIAALKNALPGEGDPNAAGVAASQDTGR